MKLAIAGLIALFFVRVAVASDAANDVTLSGALLTTAQKAQNVFQNALRDSNWKVASDALSKLAVDAPSDSVVFQLLGEIARKDHQYERAVEYFRTSIKNDPTSVTVRVRLADTYRNLDRLAEAEQQLLVASRIEPNNLSIRAEMAELHLQQEKIDKAIELIETFGANAQGNPRLLNLTVRLNALYAKKAEQLSAELKDGASFERALAFGEKLLQLGRRDTALWLTTAILKYDETNASANYLAAKIYYANGDYDRSIKFYQVALRGDPDDVAILTGHAQALARIGNKIEAEKQLNIIIDRAPSAYERKRAEYQRGLLHGEIYIGAGATLRALEQYRQMLLAFPDDLNVLDRLVNIFVADGDNAKAEEIAERIRIVRQRAEQKAQLVNQIQGALAKNNFEAGENAIAKLIEIDSNDFQAYYWRGLLLAQRNNADPALEAIKHSMALAPDNRELEKEYARILAQLGKLAEAEKEYQSLLRTETSETSKIELTKLYYFIKGQRLVSGGNLAAALAHYQSMATLFPSDVSVLEALASISIENNSLSDAEQYYKQALALDETRSMTEARLGALNQQKGDIVQSIEHFKRAILLDPVGSQGKTAIDALFAAGRQAVDQNTLDIAHQYYQAILDVFPNHPVAIAADATVLQRMQKLDDASVLYRRLIANDPRNLMVRSEYARLLSIMNEIEAAIKEYDLIMSVDHDSLQARQANANLDILYSRMADIMISELPKNKNYADAVKTAQTWMLEKHRVEPAKRLLAAITTQDPTNEKSHYWLGYLYDAQSDFEKAINETATAIALAPYNPELLFAFARILSRGGNLDIAENLAREIIRVEKGTELSDRAEQLLGFIIGQRLVAQNKVEDAIAHYQKMRAKTPNDISLLSRLSSLYLKQGDLASAEKIILSMLDKDPRNPTIHMQRAQLFKQQHDDTKYFDELRRVVELDRGGMLSREALNQMGMDEAMALMHEEKWNDAIDVFKKILEIDPGNISAGVGYATAYLELGDAVTAEQIMRTILMGRPDSLETRLKLAQLLIQTGRTTEAETELARIIAVSRDTPIGREALANITNINRARGKAFFEKGSIDEAVLAYRKAITDDPDDWQAHYELGRIFQTVSLSVGALRQKAFIDYAQARYQDVLRIKPDHYQSHYNLGSLYEMENNFEMAQSQYLKATANADYSKSDIVAMMVNGVRLQTVRFEYIKKNFDWDIDELNDMLLTQPNDIRLYLFLSTIYLQTGRLDLAITSLRKAVDLSPADSTSRYRLAQLYEQTDDLELAADQYRAIVLSGQEGLIVNAARERLEFVEERTQLLTFRLRYSNALSQSYSPSFVTKQTLRDRAFSSTLQIDSVMHVRVKKNIDLSMYATPSYTTFHDTENDSLSPMFGMSTNINYATGFIGASAGYRETKGLLQSDFRGRDYDASMSFAKRVNISLPLTDQGASSPSTIQLQLSGRQLESVDASAYSTRSFSSLLSFAYPFRDGGSWSINSGYTDTSNLKNTSSDYASRSLSLGVSLRKPLFNRVSSFINATMLYERGKKLDSSSYVAANSPITHSAIQRSVGTGLSYQLHRRLGVSFDASYSDNSPNKPQDYVYDRNGTPISVQGGNLVSYKAMRLGASLQYQF